jgi:hypothetical protein
MNLKDNLDNIDYFGLYQSTERIIARSQAEQAQQPDTDKIALSNSEGLLAVLLAIEDDATEALSANYDYNEKKLILEGAKIAVAALTEYAATESMQQQFPDAPQS